MTEREREDHKYRSLHHFARIGERQTRSELTKAQITALLHEQNEHNNENCCLRITAEKTDSTMLYKQLTIALHQVGILSRSRKTLLKATCSDEKVL